MDPYPFLCGAVTVKHKATTGLKRQSVRKEDKCPIRDTAASTQCESMYLSASAYQVPNQEKPICAASSFPSQKNKAATTISFSQGDDVDGVDDINHALRQRHWVKRQSALASKTCESSEKLPTADSKRHHDIQPPQQINNTSTTSLSIHLQPRKTSTKTVHCLIKDFMFQPEHLEIEVGDSITWLLASKSDVACEHQIISRNFLPGLCFEGPIMGGALGSTKFTRKMTEPGQLTFYCDVVPEMRGKIIVRRPEERTKVEEECFELPLTLTAKASPQGPEKMSEMAEGAQLSVPTPLIGAQQQPITKTLQVRGSGNRVKLESKKNSIPEPGGGIATSSSVVSYPEGGGAHDDSGSLDKENHTYSDDGGVHDCLSPKPSSPNTHHSLGSSSLRLQKKKKKKKKKEKKRTIPAAACKDNTYDNTTGDARKGSSAWISPQSTRPFNDAAHALESSKQMATNGSFQSSSSSQDTTNHPYLERRPRKERRGQERPRDTDTSLTGKIVIANNDETINNIKGNSNEEECEVLRVYPEAVSTGVGRTAQESSNNNGELTSPLSSTVGTKCGTEKGGNDNMWCHLKPSRNPELPSTVAVVEGAEATTTAADGDNDEIDNDRREKQSSNNISSSFKPSSEVCSLPPSTAAASSGSASMSNCSQPASSRLILPNQAMLPNCYECHCTEDKHITFGTFGEQRQHTDPISGLPPSKFEHEVVSFLRLRWEKAQFLSIIESI